MTCSMLLRRRGRHSPCLLQRACLARIVQMSEYMVFENAASALLLWHFVQTPNERPCAQEKPCILSISPRLLFMANPRRAHTLHIYNTGRGAHKRAITIL